MDVMSLYMFTLLGGIAAALYIAETFVVKERDEYRTWKFPLIVTVIFALSLLMALSHLQNAGNMFEALGRGTINFGSPMFIEVIASGVFFVALLIDLIISFTKKVTPNAVRVVVAVLGFITIVLMGTAYVGVHGVAAWTNAVPTVVMFVSTALFAGFAFFIAVMRLTYEDKIMKIIFIVLAVLALIGMGLEAFAFNQAGFGVSLVIAAILFAPVLSIVLVALIGKFKNPQVLSAIICVSVVFGVALSRYAFYMCATLL